MSIVFISIGLIIFVAIMIYLVKAVKDFDDSLKFNFEYDNTSDVLYSEEEDK